MKNVKLDHLPFHVDRLDTFIEKFNSLLHLHHIEIRAMLSQGKVSLNWIDEEIQIVEDCECKYTIFTPKLRVHEEKSFSMKNGSYKTLTLHRFLARDDKVVQLLSITLYCRGV